MEKILFVYDSMMTGGTSTALLSLINSIDRNKYEIHLLLYNNSGQHMSEIPEYVKLLPQAYKKSRILSSGHRKIIRTIINGQIFGAIKSFFKYRNTPKGNMRNILMHYGMKAQVSISRSINTRYDYAIGFMEGWTSEYITSKKINARKKYVWIHPQYKSCYLIPEIDRKTFSIADGIVLVSDDCMKQYLEFFPEFKRKTYVVPNIISTELIMKKAYAEKVVVNRTKINLCSVSRCDIKVKGLDRLLEALYKLKTEGLCKDLTFHFIGGGADFEMFKLEIEKLNLNDVIILYGNKLNPLPFLLHMDAFVLTSRYEGKPVAVTEAQVLGLPCVVTNYESAVSQVNHDYNGWIMENSSDGIYNGLKKIVTEHNILDKWRANMKNQSFGNEAEVEAFYRLINGELTNQLEK